MEKIERLKKEARDAADFRGHELGRFTRIASPRLGRNMFRANCHCGALVIVTDKILPNEVEIGGEAVAVVCEKFLETIPF